MRGQNEGLDPRRQLQIGKVSKPEMCWFYHSSSIPAPRNCTHTHTHTQSRAVDSSAAGTTPPSVQSAHHLHTLQLQAPHTHSFTTVEPHKHVTVSRCCLLICVLLYFLSLLHVHSLSFFHAYYHSPPCQCNCIPPIKRHNGCPHPSHIDPPGGQPCGNIVPHSSPTH